MIQSLLEQEWYKKLSNEQKSQILQYVVQTVRISTDIVRKREVYRSGFPENKRREVERVIAEARAILPEILKEALYADMGALERMTKG